MTSSMIISIIVYKQGLLVEGRVSWGSKLKFPAQTRPLVAATSSELSDDLVTTASRTVQASTSNTSTHSSVSAPLTLTLLPHLSQACLLFSPVTDLTSPLILPL